MARKTGCIQSSGCNPNICRLIVFLFLLIWILAGCSSTETPPSEEPPVEITSGMEEPGEIDQEPGDEMDEAQIAALFSTGQQLDDYSYEMKMLTSENEEYITRVWMKGQRMRSESEMMGETYIMIYDADAIYSLDPQEKTAFIMPMEMGLDESWDSITADELLEDADAGQWQYLGTETINGQLCQVIQVQDDEFGTTTKMWLHEEYGIPMKVETTGANPEDNFTMEVTNFQVGNVPEEMFQVPADYEITDMVDMFEGMPEMPE